MTIFFTSDLHFGHKKICELTNRNKFTSQEDHTEWLINLHNSRVQEKDVVYILGDFSFAKEKETIRIIERLNGTLVMVRGNHDSRTQFKKFERDGLIDSWHEYNELHFGEFPLICMSHYPMTVWNKQHHGSIMLHGHCHGSFQGEGKILDVGLDSSYNLYRNHQYFSLSEVLRLMEAKELVVKDHHTIKKGE